jgi:hypothetical protein
VPLSRLWKTALTVECSHSTAIPKDDQKMLISTCSLFVYFHSSFWWDGRVLQRCGEVWITGIPGG